MFNRKFESLEQRQLD